MCVKDTNFFQSFSAKHVTYFVFLVMVALLQHQFRYFVLLLASNPVLMIYGLFVQCRNDWHLQLLKFIMYFLQVVALIGLLLCVSALPFVSTLPNY